MIKYIQFSVVIILCLSMSFSSKLMAQVHINEAPNIGKLLDSYKSKNLEETHVKGWRIQIITTNDRRKMEAARAKLTMLYPDIKSDWVHESPYYKLKIGAYKNKMDLQGLIFELKQKFRGIIPVIEKIQKKDLIM